MPARGACVSVAFAFGISAAGLGRRPLGRFAAVAVVVTSGAEVPIGMNDAAGTDAVAGAEDAGNDWLVVAGTGVIAVAEDVGVDWVAAAADMDSVETGSAEDFAQATAIVDTGAGVSAIVPRSLAVVDAGTEVMTGVAD